MKLIKQQFFSIESMSEYRFTLEPYKSMENRYHCPNCNKKVFTRYVDNESNEYISDEVGKCSRLIKCGFHYTPKQYFQDNYTSFDIVKHNRVVKKIEPQSISYIDNSIVNLSLKHSNNFIQFLEVKLFDKQTTRQLINKYRLGSSTHWNGATVFWQIDQHQKVRSGKVMLYNLKDGKRIKKPYNHINWVHKLLNNKTPFNLKQCLFGLHLINEDIDKPIAIVESEKTAVISSVYIPEFIWLACGSLNNLNIEKTDALRDRNVVLFPDLKCYDLWKNKIPKLSKLANYKVSDLLELKSTNHEKERGLDLADYLIRQDWQIFRRQRIEKAVIQKTEPSINFNNEKKESSKETFFSQSEYSSKIEVLNVEQIPVKETQDWSNDIAELESYFAHIKLPTKPIQLNHYSTIQDCSVFIKSHLNIVHKNNGNESFTPYLIRLKELKGILTNV